MKITITNDEGEVYSQSTLLSDILNPGTKLMTVVLMDEDGDECTLDELLSGAAKWEKVNRCEGHPAGPNDPMGQTVYCDGTCR